MKTLVVGFGEVGRAHAEILKRWKYEVRAIDVMPDVVPENIRAPQDYRPEIMHVAIRYTPEFETIVRGYLENYRPNILSVLTTVPPGTTERFGPDTVHSTTRGLHPNLQEGLLAIPKHIGGPRADRVAAYFRRCGLVCITHNRSRTTELLHILNNYHYGVNVMAAAEMARLCREYGVDYWEYLTYTATNNTGYKQLDHESKCRMILTPPGERIGGHCLTQSAQLIPEDKRPPMMRLLARYNDPKGDQK